MVQGILESSFILRAPLASWPSEKPHRLLQPLHRVIVVFLLVGHLCKHMLSMSVIGEIKLNRTEEQTDQPALLNISTGLTDLAWSENPISFPHMLRWYLWYLWRWNQNILFTYGQKCLNNLAIKTKTYRLYWLSLVSHHAVSPQHVSYKDHTYLTHFHWDGREHRPQGVSSAALKLVVGVDYRPDSVNIIWSYEAPEIPDCIHRQIEDTTKPA